MHHQLISTVFLGLCLVAGTPSAQTAVDTLNPIKDNTLFEDEAGGLSNGEGQYLFTGQTDFSNLSRRALLAFDIAGAIPSTSTIDSVKLVLNMNRTISGGQTASLHRVLADWGEGASDAAGQEGGGTAAATNDATWIHRFNPGDLWSIPGGDFQPAASASITVSGIGQYTWGSTAEMVADVTHWLATPSSNFGWIVIGNESTTATAKRFDSQQSPTPTNRPQLIVFSTPSNEPCCVDQAGDFNNDGLSAGPVDLTFLVDFLFAGGTAPVCPEEGDFNGDGSSATPIDLSTFVDFLFAGGVGPADCP